MSARTHFNFPPQQDTSVATIPIEGVPEYASKKNLGRNRIYTDMKIPLPDVLFGYTDGERLFILSSNDKNIFFSVISLVCYAFSIIALISSIVIYTTLDNSFNAIPVAFYWHLSIGLFLFAVAMILTFKNKNKILSKFIVFDRSTGLVSFPDVFWWPQLVVPFNLVECYTEHWVGKTGMHFYALLYPRVRKVGEKGYRREILMAGSVNNERDIIQQWNYITAFMDKTHEISIKARSTHKIVSWFREHELTFEKIMQDEGIASLDHKTNEFIWRGNKKILGKERKFKIFELGEY